MNRERLNIQIDVLRQVEADHRRFNMSHWIGDDGCGTSCCALGYAALDPRLQAEGLVLAIRTTPKTYPIKSLAEFNDTNSWGSRVSYGDYSGFAAAWVFYGISHYAAGWLFDPVRYNCPPRDIKPADVIARIEEVMALGGFTPGEMKQRAADIKWGYLARAHREVANEDRA